MAFSTTTFFIDPVHEDFLRAFADALSGEGGIDGYFTDSDSGVSLGGTLDGGFTLLVWGLMDGAPRIRPEALSALVKTHPAFRSAWTGRIGDDPIEIGEVLQAILEPDTHVILRYHTADGTR